MRVQSAKKITNVTKPAPRRFRANLDAPLVIPAVISAMVVALLAFPGRAVASVQLSIIDLGTLGGTYSAAQAINNSGEIVGESSTASGELHAFLWQDGTMIDLGTLGGTYSSARGINERGQVVGSNTIGSGESRAFLWQNGVLTDLGTLGGRSIGSTANAINNQGQVVGACGTSTGELHAFLWQDGIMTDLGVLSGTFSSAQSINEHGQIVGFGEGYSFIWQH